jgi:hypothetical protein
MSLIEKSGQIPDMYNLRHKHDSICEDFALDYGSKLLPNSLSPELYKNNKNETVLNGINDLLNVIVDEILPVRNIFFFTHTKHYNKHGK